MERIITKIAADFKRDAEEFLAKGRRDIRAAEEFFVPRIGEMVTELLSAVYEEADRELLENRAGRRQAGLVVERRGEPRTILSQLGSITYHQLQYGGKKLRQSKGTLSENPSLHRLDRPGLHRAL